jgi:two-component system, NtrC family, sensor kinase
MGEVSTIQAKCRRCYACVRNCPAKAIMVKEGQAQVLDERCIRCGSCVRVCAQKAKQIESGIEAVESLLASENKTIAILAPSFPAFLRKATPQQLVGGLLKLGFNETMEVAFGAELVAREYARLMEKNGGRTLITTPCPAVFYFIQQHVPELVPYLAPVVSPMVALGRVIKWEYAPEAKVVFIGPCIGKKREMKDPEVAGVVDAVLTFTEMRALLESKDIRLLEMPEAEFNGPKPSIARIFPVSGGLLKTAGISADILESDLVITEGKDRFLQVIEEVQKGGLKAKFLDVLFCEGCINGPVLEEEGNLFTRKDKVVSYLLSQKRREQSGRTDEGLLRYRDVNMSRTFKDLRATLPMPKEEEITAILAKVNKTKPEDELNCGSCGYASCREKAVAVFQGIAELEMCLPYLIDKTEESYRELGRSHEEMKQSYAMLEKTYRTLELTQKQLVQSEKLASIGRLSTSVAHEVNNPLAGILTYTKLLLKRLEKGVPEGKDLVDFKKYLTTIERETTRCGNIARGLLDVGRPTAPAMRLCDLVPIVDKTVALIQNQASLQGVTIVRDIAKGLPQFWADPNQLQQVLVNLTVNALQAMPDGGKLEVTASVDPSLNEILLRIKDTGCGISQEDIPQLFEPYFTKRKGGVGLGLSVVYNIISKHRGRIEVESEVGKGSTFMIHLPLTKALNGS